MKALLALLVSSAFAQQPQQPPDPAFMQKAIGAMQQQRNQAYDQAAIAEARAAQLADEVAKLKAELDELKKTTPAK